MNTSRIGKRVLVAMSGGVDSSVAAVLMTQKGYDVVGVTIKTYDYEDVGGNDDRDSSCCSIDGINMARSVANRYSFPHYVFDFSERFRKEVIDEFAAEYLAGRTPNPCVICNRKIKWEYLLEKADSLGADFICTGHYARVRFDAELGRHVLSRGIDTTKDQSYALYGLTQESLSRTIFPLGDMTKPQVRELALKRSLASAAKAESYEICFVTDNDYGRFLRDYVPGLGERINGGNIMFRGKPLGKHKGYAFYTIGQRKGLGVSHEMPLYVSSIDAAHNIVEVDDDRSLYSGALVAERANMIKYATIPPKRAFRAKIRYKDGGADCTARQPAVDRLEVRFVSPRRAITPGQSVVIYEGDDVVAGGIIASSVE